MVWMVLSYCSISSGRQRGWQAHSWGSIVSVSLCYALKCTRLVNSQVRWFLCISMQLGGLDDDLFKERFVSFSLFFFFFFSLSFFFGGLFSQCVYMHTSEIAVLNSGARSSFQKSYLVPGGSWIRKVQCIVVIKVLMIAWGLNSLFFSTYGV